MSTEYDHLLKLVLVGDASVGKSSLLLRFVDGSFDVDLPATIGVDFKVRRSNRWLRQRRATPAHAGSGAALARLTMRPGASAAPPRAWQPLRSLCCPPALAPFRADLRS